MRLAIVNVLSGRSPIRHIPRPLSDNRSLPDRIPIHKVVSDDCTQVYGTDSGPTCVERTSTLLGPWLRLMFTN
jgi:hypothetical protein